MFAFTLGTSPVFFAVSYFATQMGAKLEKQFVRFVAVVVLILAIVTINSGLALAGSPISLSRLPIGLHPAPQNVSAVPSEKVAIGWTCFSQTNRGKNRFGRCRRNDHRYQC